MVVTGSLKWRQQEMRRAECAPPIYLGHPFKPSNMTDDQIEALLNISPGPIRFEPSPESSVQFIAPRIPAWRRVSRRA